MKYSWTKLKHVEFSYKKYILPGSFDQLLREVRRHTSAGMYAAQVLTGAMFLI